MCPPPAAAAPAACSCKQRRGKRAGVRVKRFVCACTDVGVCARVPQHSKTLQCVGQACQADDVSQADVCCGAVALYSQFMLASITL
jgi:hypothetical protein